MMNIDSFISWLGVMLPLMISPGPANILLAGAGMKQGLRRSIPLIAGINIVIAGYSLLIGFGLGEFIKHYPKWLLGIKIAGILYIFYLAYKFLKAKKTTDSEETVKVYGFYDGVILQLLNPKGMLSLFLMFSLFLDAQQNQGRQAITLTLMLLVLTVLCHILWISTGNFITRFIRDKKSRKVLNYIFSASLVLVALWLLIDAVGEI
ncbi:LysE family translocator [Sinomicrobium oceani]|uniref:LysE family translocator n=1 Tax=Sinomicrobium oceani TaxID=1150368 RepID=UPI00227A7B23|nr:LysE family translocator [Sinomicrobium oceani]